MPKIKINKNHNLPMEELHKRAEELVEKLQDRMASLNMDYEWRPDKSGIDFKSTAGDPTWLPVDGFLDKPVDAEVLIAEAEKLLAKA